MTRGAGVRLSGLIIAALETGCRRGELLNLRWAEVNLRAREITIRADRAKTGTTGTVPISSRLAAAFEIVLTDPAARDYPPSA